MKWWTNLWNVHFIKILVYFVWNSCIEGAGLLPKPSLALLSSMLIPSLLPGAPVLRMASDDLCRSSMSLPVSSEFLLGTPSSGQPLIISFWMAIWAEKYEPPVIFFPPIPQGNHIFSFISYLIFFYVNFPLSSFSIFLISSLYF